MAPWVPTAVSAGCFLIAQGGFLLIWGSNLSARVKVLEREMSGTKKVSDAVISLTAKVENIGEDVTDIKGLIDGLRGPLRPRS